MTHTALLPRHPGTLRPVVACIAMLVLGSQAALAQTPPPQPLGPFSINAGYALQTDSNLFRASTNAQSEQIGVTTLGLAFDSKQGLQEFVAHVSAVDSKYKNFDYLSFTATNYDAAWRWAVSPEWTGNLSTRRAETLNSFANTTTTTQRNRRVDTGSTLDTTYVLQGAWAAVAGISTSKQVNDFSVIGADDSSSNTGDLGVQYSFSSGSSISFRSNLTNGSYLNRTVPNALLADDGFKETAQDVRLHWTFSGASAADAYITAINRTHPNYAVRDYSGTNYGASMSWSLSGKTGVQFAASHTLAAYETLNTNYSTTDSVSVTPAWQISPKISLRLNAQWGQVGYGGSPTAGVPTLDRKDNTQDTSLALIWTPTQAWNVIASVQKSTRSSNLAGNDYDANVASLSATFTF